MFDYQDEEIMTTFLNIAGPILANSSLYMQIQGKSRKDDAKETGESGVLKSKGAVSKMAGFEEQDEEEVDE